MPFIDTLAPYSDAIDTSTIHVDIFTFHRHILTACRYRKHIAKIRLQNHTLSTRLDKNSDETSIHIKNISFCLHERGHSETKHQIVYMRIHYFLKIDYLLSFLFYHPNKSKSHLVHQNQRKMINKALC